MFGGPPPQATPEEIRREEDDATSFVQKVIIGCVLLYLSPHAVAFAKKMIF